MHDADRRVFLTRLTKGSLAVAVLGIAACAEPSTAPITGVAATGTDSPTTTGTVVSPTTSLESPTTTKLAGLVPVDWQRVDLQSVSAYVLIRGGEIALVDTGNPGSAGDIEAVMSASSLSWSDVGHVIATHSHGDHVGSLAAVLDLAPAATAYAGAADIPAINAPRPIEPVGDGDQVFNLTIIETPGHTPGHISVLDPAGLLLLAGDALRGGNGGVVGPAPQFTDDLPLADESVRKLGGFDYETILFGHGEPVLALGSQQVKDLGAST